MASNLSSRSDDDNIFRKWLNKPRLFHKKHYKIKENPKRNRLKLYIIYTLM